MQYKHEAFVLFVIFMTLQTAALIWQFRDHKGIVNSVCVHNDILFTAGYDKIVRCYDLKVCQWFIYLILLLLILLTFHNITFSMIYTA